MPGFVLIVLVVLAAAIGFAISNHRKKVGAAWDTAAERLGLVHDAGTLFKGRTLQGAVDDTRVEVDVYTESHGKSSTTYTRYRAYYPEPLGLGLELKPEGFFSGVAKFFGAQDLEVGDGEFDREVVVKGREGESIVAFLTPSRRVSVLRLFQVLPDSLIDDHGVRAQRKGTETDPARLAGTLRRVLNLANLLTASESAVPLDRAIEARRRGRLDEALQHVRELPATAEAPGAEGKLLEGQILYAGEQFEEAAEAFAQGSEHAPDDDELGAWAERARELATAAEPPPADRPATPLEPVPAADVAAEVVAVGPDSRAVCDELFDPAVLSLEANRRFEQGYQGARVRWSGTLREVSRYSFDLVFGNAPGTRAVVELHEVGGGVFARTAQAVLQLPPEAFDALEGRRDQPLAFEGTLVRCDAFLRNLFVEGAAVGDG
jgi:hypothetical protein